MDPAALAGLVKPAAIDSLMEGVMAELERGFTMVDRVYELGPAIPKFGPEGGAAPPDVVEFAMERARASVRFTASLYLTAWERSQAIRLDGWLDRSGDR
jgi:hypothetical protein